ncbi:AI-2E family transporter, partial [Anaerosporobacter sp.]
MGFDKTKLKQIRWLIVFVAVIVCALMYSNTVVTGIVIGIQIIKPFIYGGVIAFILNIPLKLFENKLLKNWNGKLAKKVKRPICILLSIITVLLIISLVIVAVIPQLAITTTELGHQIPVFIDRIIDWLEQLSVEYPSLKKQIMELENMEINWKTMIPNVIDFMKNGFGNMLYSTVTVAGSIIGGVINFVVGIIFSLYILIQKEKLSSQGKRIMSAYLPTKVDHRVREVLARLHSNFTNFICGQCLEAVILGTLFIITMTIFRMPYAVTIGTLIAFTALIPIVGAFIGCAVGAFMILINSPTQALLFIILFLILQQIEGNLIYPKVVGNSVGLPSIWVLVAVSVGGSLFGIAGMLFFIPVVSTVYSLLRDDVNIRNRKKKRIINEASVIE